MTEPLIREYEKEDIPALVSLWSSVFGDSPQLAGTFFRLLPGTGTCLVAEENSTVCGMSSILTDLRVCLGERCFSCAYLYAVAVDPSFRGHGLGSGLSKAAADFGRQGGAELICTLPADEGLYSMYEKAIGTRFCLSRSPIRIPAGLYPETVLSLSPADPAEYNRKREAILLGRPHLSVSDSSIAFLKALCEENGGGLFVSDQCAAAYYTEGDSLHFSELLCGNEMRIPILAQTAFAKGLSTADCPLPSVSGNKYIAYDRNILPAEVIWNISLD